VGSEIEIKHASQVNVAMGSRRDFADYVVGQDFRLCGTSFFDVQGISGHQDVRDQRQCPGYRRQLIVRAAALRPKVAIVDGAFHEMHGLALIQQFGRN
jgi:hypothetical protein